MNYKSLALFGHVHQSPSNDLYLIRQYLDWSMTMKNLKYLFLQIVLSYSPVATDETSDSIFTSPLTVILKICTKTRHPPSTEHEVEYSPPPIYNENIAYFSAFNNTMKVT